MPETDRPVGAWWPVVQWLLAIAAGTSVPVPEGIGAPWMAKVAHSAGSAILSFFTFRALRRSLGPGRRIAGLLTGLAGGFVMTLSEARQGASSSRMSLLSDAVANLLGVIAGGMTAAVMEDRR